MSEVASAAVSCRLRRWTLFFFEMSTLAEIEAALNAEELAHLETRVQIVRQQGSGVSSLGTTGLEEFA